MFLAKKIIDKSTWYFLFSLFLIAIIFSVFVRPNISLSQTANLTPEQQAQLRAELAKIEQEIKDQQVILDSKAKEGTSIERDIAILNAKIKTAQLKIRSHEISINNLGKDIVVKTNTINALSERIGKGKESLAQIIEKTRELDDSTFIESFLSNKNLSEFFIDFDNFTSIKQSMNIHLDNVKDAKHSNEVVKEELGVKRNKEIDLKVDVEKEQANIKKLEAEKKRLLSLNKTEQQNYKTAISSKQKRASEIRNALFPLIGTSQKINFETALKYAEEAKQKFGIDPAFLLAVITNESNLGADVGRCNTKNTKKWNQILPGPSEKAVHSANGGTCRGAKMPCSSRDDQTPFLNIISSLGKKPEDVVLSCPILADGPWGGAMGPAQFIPSTWSGLSGRLKSLLGYSANPWVAHDAFMASAMFLTDLGGVGDSYTAQIRAACKYYGSGGSSCSYGNNVMKIKTTVQSKIDAIR